MTGIADMFALGFLIGLTGAIAPGPMLVAAINASVKGGWTAGPKVTLGHMVVEVLIFALVAGGLSVVLGGYFVLIAAIGGAALVTFGIFTLIEARQARIDIPQDHSDATKPVLNGFLASISNPYFWIWWLTVGSALLAAALQGGIPVMIAFVAGHWAADLSWYTLVAAGMQRGRFFLNTRSYRIVLASCGVFLTGFGAYYLATAVFL